VLDAHDASLQRASTKAALYGRSSASNPLNQSSSMPEEQGS